MVLSPSSYFTGLTSLPAHYRAAAYAQGQCEIPAKKEHDGIRPRRPVPSAPSCAAALAAGRGVGAAAGPHLPARGLPRSPFPAPPSALGAADGGGGPARRGLAAVTGERKNG